MVLVISTPLAALCRDLTVLMRDTVLKGASDVPGQLFLTPDIYIAETV